MDFAKHAREAKLAREEYKLLAKLAREAKLARQNWPLQAPSKPHSSGVFQLKSALGASLEVSEAKGQ